MIDKNEVVAFFDSLASGWDADMIRNEDAIASILDNAGVREGSRVLDIACGTGVLVPDYLSRGASVVVGVDISPEMIAVAKGKIADSRVSFVCADAETGNFGKDFDCIVVYNAFPHFSDPEVLISNLSSMLAPGGTLTVAHGMSRETINLHHGGRAGKVSRSLPEAGELAALFSHYLDVTAVVSDDRMYQVCGNLKNRPRNY